MQIAGDRCRMGFQLPAKMSPLMFKRCVCVYIYIYIKSNQVIYQWIMLPIAMLDRQRISTVSYGHHDQSPCRRDTPFTEHQLIGAVNPQ